MTKRKKYMIYKIEYLKNASLTDEDLHYLLDTSSLTLSLVAEMFKVSGQPQKESFILKTVTEKDNWFDSYKWTYKQYSSFFKDLIKIYKNIYQVSDIDATSRAQWWLTMYGFKVSNYKNI